MESIILILVPIGLLFLPADFFDDGESMCLSVQLFDKECYGCGMTRSLMHLIHLDYREAFYHNPIGIFVGLIIAALIIFRLQKNITQLVTQNS